MHPGVPGDKAPQEHRQQGRHDRGDDPKGKGPPDKAFFLIHDILDAGGLIYDGARLVHDLPAGLGDPNGLLAPVEDLDAQFVFELLHLHAQGGLRHEALFGRQGKVSVFGHGQHILELGDGHPEYLCCL